MDKLMTRQTAATQLGITTRTLDRWLRDARVPIRAKRLGPHVVRVSAEDVRRLASFEGEPAI